MQIMPLTYADGGLAEIAGRIVETFFPEQIAEFWRVGALVHQPITATVKLFVDGSVIGRLTSINLPGGEKFFAIVEDDFRATVQAHGVCSNAAGVCDRQRGVILVCLSRFDLRGTDTEMLLIHELAHTVTAIFPEHGPAWCARMRRAARTARRSGALALAAMLEVDAAANAVHGPSKPDPARFRADIEEVFRQEDEDRLRFAVTVEDGLTLAAWLDARQSTRRQAVSGSHSERRRE